MDDFALRPPPPVPKTGAERFRGTDATVLDFWRFAMSNFTMNNVRGYVAEFLVARAIGAHGPRVEWDAYDVVAPDGTTIEVKSSAYVQAWEQRAPSRITFTGLKGRIWDSATGLSGERTYNADVYVFAVNTAQTHEEYDALDVSTWRFYVASRASIEQLGYRSLSLPTLERLAGPGLPYEALAESIHAAAGEGRAVRREDTDPSARTGPDDGGGASSPAVSP